MQESLQTYNIFLHIFMKPKQPQDSDNQLSLMKVELTSIISMTHELVKLSQVIDWKSLENQFGTFYSDIGRAGISSKLMISLHYLKYLHDLSDEEVVSKWVENPYWQFFSGMKYFEHKKPINSSSMTKWRKRIAKSGAEELLKETIKAGLLLKVVKPADIKNVNVDTTAQEKNIRFPTDARLYDRGLQNLTKMAKQLGIVLRQTYTRTRKKFLIKQQRAAHSRKFKDAKTYTKKLRTLLGRVIRDIERKKVDFSDKNMKLLSICKRIFTQEKNDKNKIYSVHEPNVSCIAKGKVHKKYEFGSKISVVSTNKSNFILGAVNFQGNPHDGKTLSTALAQVKTFGYGLENIFVDQGYKGHGIKDYKVHICKNQKKSSSKSLWNTIKRRAAIEPIIGHLKSDYRLDCNRLSDIVGDELNIIFSCAASNLKKIINHIIKQGKVEGIFFCLLFVFLLASLSL